MGRVETARCPICHDRLKASRLQGHLARVHSKAVLAKEPIAPAPKEAKKHKNKAKTQNSSKAGLGWKPIQIDALEAWRQSFDESRDGSKGLGHMRRENGKFGSYPMHDNYDDESDSN